MAHIQLSDGLHGPNNHVRKIIWREFNGDYDSLGGYTEFDEWVVDDLLVGATTDVVVCSVKAKCWKGSDNVTGDQDGFGGEMDQATVWMSYNDDTQAMNHFIFAEFFRNQFKPTEQIRAIEMRSVPLPIIDDNGVRKIKVKSGCRAVGTDTRVEIGIWLEYGIRFDETASA